MEKEYDAIYFLDLKDMISKRWNIEEERLDDVRSYLTKLGLDPEEDPLINVSPLDTETMGHLILDIITHYEMRHLKK